MKHYKIQQGGAEWHQRRLGIPTSSRFPRIITRKKRQPSSQAEDFMFTLLGERMTGEPADLFQNYAMQRGQELEDDAFRAYEDEHGPTEPGGFFVTDQDHIGCSPDRLVGAEGLLEIKCPLPGTMVRAAILGDAAEDHMTQIQGQLWLTERQWVDVFHFHECLILPARRFYRDDNFIRELSAIVTAFSEVLESTWISFEKKFGPFVKPKHKIPPAIAKDDPLGVNPEDVDLIFAQQLRELRERQNG